MGLAAHVARRFGRRGPSADDLRQVAFLALVKAVDRFDPERNVAFSTFAGRTIEGEIKRHFRDHTWSVRVPRSAKETHLQLRRATDELTQRSGRSPTVQQLAEHLGPRTDEVIEGSPAGSAYSTTSLDAPTGADGDGTRQIGGEDEHFGRLADWTWSSSCCAAAASASSEIVRLRFYEELSQSEIAERIGISQMHVSRLLRRSFEQMRPARPGDRRRRATTSTSTDDAHLASTPAARVAAHARRHDHRRHGLPDTADSFPRTRSSRCRDKDRRLVRTMRTFGRAHRWVVRRSGGRLGNRWYGGSDVVLLTVRGRSTGRLTPCPLMTLPEGRDVLVVASQGGVDREPQWWLNLLVDPQAEVKAAASASASSPRRRATTSARRSGTASSPPTPASTTTRRRSAARSPSSGCDGSDRTTAGAQRWDAAETAASVRGAGDSVVGRHRGAGAAALEPEPAGDDDEHQRNQDERLLRPLLARAQGRDRRPGEGERLVGEVVEAIDGGRRQITGAGQTARRRRSG